MSAYIGPSTKRNTAEQKTIYENSDQILALEVSLFVQIKTKIKMFATTILALRSIEVLLFCNRSTFRPPKPEVNLQYILDKSRYPIPITDDRVGRKMDVIQCSKLKF